MKLLAMSDITPRKKDMASYAKLEGHQDQISTIFS